MKFNMIMFLAIIYLSQSLEFEEGKCGGKHGYFCYSDEAKKELYYVCSKGNKVASERECCNNQLCVGKNEYEKSSNLICVDEANAHWDIVLPPVDCSKVENGYYCYQGEGNEDKYYWCSDGVGQEMKCASGTVCHTRENPIENPCGYPTA